MTDMQTREVAMTVIAGILLSLVTRFWPTDDQMLYPVVVLDDGTYVPFWDIRPIRWEL